LSLGRGFWVVSACPSQHFQHMFGSAARLAAPHMAQMQANSHPGTMAPSTTTIDGLGATSTLAVSQGTYSLTRFGGGVGVQHAKPIHYRSSADRGGSPISTSTRTVGYAEKLNTVPREAATRTQPLSMGHAEHYLRMGRSIPSGVNLATPAAQRNNPNNLLAGGVVVEERVVDIEELMATGRLVQKEDVRDQPYRSSAQTLYTDYVPVEEYITEISTPPWYNDYAPMEVPEMPAPVMYTDEYVTEERLAPGAW